MTAVGDLTSTDLAAIRAALTAAITVSSTPWGSGDDPSPYAAAYRGALAKIAGLAPTDASGPTTPPTVTPDVTLACLRTAGVHLPDIDGALFDTGALDAPFVALLDELNTLEVYGPRVTVRLWSPAVENSDAAHIALVIDEPGRPRRITPTFEWGDLADPHLAGTGWLHAAACSTLGLVAQTRRAA